MTERSAVHGSFTIEREIPAAPSRVYAAFATEEGKKRWFSGPDGWTETERIFDFRIGGSERTSGIWPNGTTTRFDAQYLDVIPHERIIYSYEMHLNEKKISVSLATVEFKPEGEGTKLVITEQGVFIDGYEDNGSREQGTRYLMERVAATLA